MQRLALTAMIVLVAGAACARSGENGVSGGPLIVGEAHAGGPCHRESIVSSDGWAQVRRQPNLDGAPLWRITNGSVLAWCGAIRRDGDGRLWHFIRFVSAGEPWQHAGWVAAGLLTETPNTVSETKTAPPSAMRPSQPTEQGDPNNYSIATGAQIIRRPPLQGGNVTASQWVAEMKAKVRSIYEMRMNSLTYPLKDPSSDEALARSDAISYLYNQASDELSGLNSNIIIQIVNDVKAYIKTLDYTTPPRNDSVAIKCDSYPYGDNSSNIELFNKNFSVLGDTEHILIQSCMEKFWQQSREDMHNIGISDEEIDMKTVSDLAVEIITHTWCRMHGEPLTCEDK